MDTRLDLRSTAPVALGLSGGGDSIALLHLAILWARRHGRPVLALTVDHGLNAQSADWTAAAGEAAMREGAAWRGLAWTDVRPTTGLAAAARRARHALLATAAREAGAGVLLLGHTAGDRAENAVMRSGDVPAMGRLTGWAPSPVWPEGHGVMLGRPLLTVARADLRQWLSARGERWLDDPANADPASPRVRARQALADGGAQSVDTGSPRDLSALAAAVHRKPLGGFSLPRVQLREAGGADATVLVALMCVCAGGGEAIPRRGRAAALAERLRAGGPVSATLAGALVRADAEVVRISRAPKRRRGPQALPSLQDGSDGLAGMRFAAAAGLLPDEASAVAAARACTTHGVSPQVILS